MISLLGFGLLLVQISVNPLVLHWLISRFRHLPKLLISFGIHSRDQLLIPGVSNIALALIILILNRIFNYDGYPASLICKKTKKLATQA